MLVGWSMAKCWFGMAHVVGLGVGCMAKCWFGMAHVGAVGVGCMARAGAVRWMARLDGMPLTCSAWHGLEPCAGWHAMGRATSLAGALQDGRGRAGMGGRRTQGCAGVRHGQPGRVRARADWLVCVAHGRVQGPAAHWCAHGPAHCEVPGRAARWGAWCCAHVRAGLCCAPARAGLCCVLVRAGLCCARCRVFASLASPHAVEAWLWVNHGASTHHG